MIHAIAMFRVSLVCKATFVTDHTMIPHTCDEGAQWLSGRVPDSRRKAAGSSLTGAATALFLWARYINHCLKLHSL